jgi:hypothetical protein
MTLEEHIEQIKIEYPEPIILDNLVHRKMTDDEKDEWYLEAARMAKFQEDQVLAAQTAAKAKAAAEAKLQTLGLTKEDLQALGL